MKQAILNGWAAVCAAILATGCASNAPQPSASTNTVANTKATTANSSAAPLVSSSHSGAASSHSTTADPNQSNTLTNGAASGRNPMERPVDTGKFDEAIIRAEKEFRAKPKDETAKKALADAFADRAFALTEAAQYRSALGDFRRALKLDPNNQEAKKAQNQILDIFASLKREPPKEGAEPAPLPFTRET